MIENENQYRVTKEKLGEINQKIAAYEKCEPGSKEELVLVSLQLMKKQMDEEVAGYENRTT